MMNIQFIFIFTLLFQTSLADLPVHCLAKQVQGEWNLYTITKQSGMELNLEQCGHKHPDENTDHLHFDFKKEFEKYDQQKTKVKLLMPDVVEYIDIGGSVINGKWTMIYDEGFQINILNKTYFAFSKYNDTSIKSPGNQDDEQTAGYQSLCNQTFLGWVYDEANDERHGCFYAEKMTSDIELENISSEMNIEYKIQNYNQQKITERSVEQLEKLRGSNSFQSFLQTQNLQEDFYHKLQTNQILYEMPHQNIMQQSSFIQNDENLWQHDYEFISKINDAKNKSPWKAKAHKHFENKSQSFMKKLIGMTPNKQNKMEIIQQMSFLQTQSQVFMESKTSKKNRKQRSFLQMQYGSTDQILLRKKNSTNIEDQHQKTSTSQVFEKLEDEFKQFLKKMDIDQNVQPSQVDKSLDNLQEKESEIKKDLLQNLQKKLNDDQEVCGKSQNDVPRCYDIRNIDGVNYDTVVKHQGDCGSCYVVSALSSLESRIRIKSKNQHKPNLSINGALSCGQYTQGCNGGYPELVAKFGKEKGFYTQSCDMQPPREENDQECMDHCFKNKNKIWFVEDFGYVGKGYYGSTDEQSMMKEIYENGPIIVALNAAPDLYYYSSGVFITNAQEPLIQDNGNSKVNPWQFTNHAVTCIGWGEQMHEGHLLKYWILKNSWGQEWGENGYFKMLKGVNLAAIENQAIYINPKMRDEQQ